MEHRTGLELNIIASSEDVRVAMAEEQFCLRCNNHQPNFISVFTHLLRTESMVDVTLAAEGKHLQAHRVVLSACSPYFQMLFTMNPCQHPIVILTDVKYSDLKIIVDFMYYGEVNITHEQLPAILKAAERLEVKGLPDNKRLQEASAGSGSGSTGPHQEPLPQRAEGRGTSSMSETGRANLPQKLRLEDLLAAGGTKRKASQRDGEPEAGPSTRSPDAASLGPRQEPVLQRAEGRGTSSITSETGRANLPQKLRLEDLLAAGGTKRKASQRDWEPEAGPSTRSPDAASLGPRQEPVLQRAEGRGTSSITSETGRANLPQKLRLEDLLAAGGTKRKASQREWELKAGPSTRSPDAASLGPRQEPLPQRAEGRGTSSSTSETGRANLPQKLRLEDLLAAGGTKRKASQREWELKAGPSTRSPDAASLAGGTKRKASQCDREPEAGPSTRSPDAASLGPRQEPLPQRAEGRGTSSSTSETGRANLPQKLRLEDLLAAGGTGGKARQRDREPEAGPSTRSPDADSPGPLQEELAPILEQRESSGSTPEPSTANRYEILLQDWYPVLIGGQLHLEGIRYIGQNKTKYLTAAVTSRVGQSCSQVRLSGGNTCQLIGELHDVRNRLPNEIRHKFRHGIPRFWKLCIENWRKNEGIGRSPTERSKRGRPLSR